MLPPGTRLGRRASSPPPGSDGFPSLPFSRFGISTEAVFSSPPGCLLVDLGLLPGEGGSEWREGRIREASSGLTEALAGATTPQPAGRGVGEGGAGLASEPDGGDAAFHHAPLSALACLRCPFVKR